MKDCCRRLDRMDHVDRFPGINDRGVEIPHRSRRGITSALGMHFCFQHLFSVVPFSPERVSERAAGIVGRPIHPSRPIEHRRAKRVVATAGGALARA